MSSPNPRDTWQKKFLCPYCGDDKGDESNNSCCKENHCRWVWVDEDGNEMEDVE